VSITPAEGYIYIPNPITEQVHYTKLIYITLMQLISIGPFFIEIHFENYAANYGQ